jgi:uncharacterized protein
LSPNYSSTAVPGLRNKPKGAQLIFNSHEATLLGDSSGDRVLGRDQVWFTEKGHDGASRLYALSDLSPGSDEAIRRRYLAGRYGAAPILSAEEFTEVARSTRVPQLSSALIGESGV